MKHRKYLPTFTLTHIFSLHSLPHSLPVLHRLPITPHPSLSPQLTPALFCFCVLSTTEYIWATSSSSSFPFFVIFFLSFWGIAYRSPPSACSSSMVLGSCENKKTFTTLCTVRGYMCLLCSVWCALVTVGVTEGTYLMQLEMFL